MITDTISVDTSFANSAKLLSGHWCKYPYESRWPSEADGSLDTLRIFANRLRVKTASKWGPLQRTDTEKFMVCMDTRTRDIYLKWTKA